MSPQNNPTSPDENSHKDVRCLCGQLLARLKKEGLELKCKRCKQITLVPAASIQGWKNLLPHLTEKNW